MVLDELSEKMLKILIDSKDSFVTTTDLANSINMSVSTIKNNMKNVKKIISTYNAQLVSTPGIGVQISATNEQIQEIKKLISDNSELSSNYFNRKKYILDILFQRNANYTIQVFADDLNVGKNVILNDFDRMEKWLKKFDISIDKVRNLGVVLKGSEFNIRQAIIKDLRFYDSSVYLSKTIERPRDLDYRIDIEFNNYFQRFFSLEELRRIQDMIWEIEDGLKETFTDSSFCQLTEYLAIMAQRTRKGYFIQESQCPKTIEINLEKYDQIARSIVDKYFNDLQENEKAAESHFLTALLLTFYTQEGNVKMAGGEKYYTDLARQFIGKIAHVLNKEQLLSNVDLIRIVASFFESVQVQNKFNILIRGSNRKEIKQMIPSIYAICLTVSEEFEKSLQLSFNEEDLARLAMIINNAINEFYIKKEAILVTASDHQTSKYIAGKIATSIPNLVITEIAKYNGMKTIANPTNQLVISTVPLPNQDIVQITKSVSEEDIKNIEQAIMIRDGINEFIENDFRAVFSPELMIKNFAAKNKNEVIAYGCSLLNELGYVDNDFESQILQRETITPTSIGNLMAVPHGYSSYLKKCGVAVIQLRRPIEWTDEDKVDLVFLMAINFVTAHEVYDFFRKFYAFIDNAKNIENLKNAANEVEMFEIITKTQTLNS